MNIRKINILLPFFPPIPGGGPKVMFELANRLAEKGFDVFVYYPVLVSFLPNGYPAWVKYIYLHYFKKRVTWFKFNNNVKQKVIYKIGNGSIRDADILLSTWWSVIYASNILSIGKGKRYNLVQDIEYWLGNEKKVNETFSEKGVTQIAITGYIADHIKNVSGSQAKRLRIGIDQERFYQKTEPGSRKADSLCMLYSTEERKGSEYGIQALEIVKKQHPSFTAVLFSVYPRPANLPLWIEFHQQPGNLTELYNKCAIFFTPSNFEGLGLPSMEAMLCGCAVVCTEVGGHKEFARENDNALFVTPKNTDEMSRAILSLINDTEKRNQLAANGRKTVQEFTWENTVEQLLEIFNGQVKIKSTNL